VELLSGDQVVAEVFVVMPNSLIITTFENEVPVIAIEELITKAQTGLLFKTPWLSIVELGR
jgi:hypothetical protein